MPTGKKEVIGAEEFLAQIGEELRGKSYRPQAVRRCWIDKPGKPEKRPLGIPVVKDRVVQMAAKLILEPIFEANFLDCSFGFRPGRNAHQAIKKIRSQITFGRQTVVIDADIKGYFDAIRHDILLRQVQKRVSDPRMINLIRGWLKAGVMEEGRHSRTSAGTPQGGVISPLLANIYLHSFDKMFEQSAIPGTLVRYADDFVILLYREKVPPASAGGHPAIRRMHMSVKRMALGALMTLAVASAATAAELSPIETLGKKLFFDTSLSTPPRQGCVSCHDPATGWTGPDSDINAAGAVNRTDLGSLGLTPEEGMAIIRFMQTLTDGFTGA